MINNCYNIVLLSDSTEVLYMQKNLGPYKVANALRRVGYEVLVVNHLHGFSLDEIKDILRQSVNDRTLFVGINSFFYRSIENPQLLTEHAHEKGGKKYYDKQLGSYLPHGKKYNLEIKNLIQQLNPKCQVVLGGPDARDTEHIQDFDYVILGYADNAVVNLANHLANGTELKNSRKSVFGACIIDDAMAKDYDFVGTKMYYADHDFILPGETLVIEIGRGCIFKCKFCAFPMNGKTKNDYIKLEDILFEEFLENYQRFGVTRYIFSDDTFNDTVDKIKMIHRVSQKLPFQLEYWAYIRLDLLAAYPETIDLLYQSGLRACHFGIETMHPESAKIIGKGGDRQKMIDTLHYMKSQYSHNITLEGSFIFGLPNEPVDSMMKTAEMLLDRSIPLDSWAIYPLVLYRNMVWLSELDLNLDKYGYQIEKYVDQFSIWKSSFASFEECHQLARKTMQTGLLQNIVGVSALEKMYIAGLGFDLEYTKDKRSIEFNWNSVDLKKQERMELYRKKLFEYLKITAVGLTTKQHSVIT